MRSIRLHPQSWQVLFVMSLVATGLLFSFCPSKASAQTEPTKVETLIHRYLSGDQAEATHALIQLAYQGNVAAQFNLGVINLARGDDLISAKEARFWFERAAEEGDLGAQFNIGMLLLSGNDPQALDTASLWLERAAEGGNRSAQVNVGILSLWWPGFPLAKAAGREWLTLAMDSGDDSAEKILALGEDSAVAGSALEFLYPIEKTLRAEVSSGESRVKRDAAPIFALPTERQEPVDRLAENTPVEVLKQSSGWINVRPKRGLPLWISADVAEVYGNQATVSVLETGIYVAPYLDPEVFKVGSVTKDETLTLLTQQQSWLQVEAPRRFTGWMREEDIDVRLHATPVDEAITRRIVAHSQQPGIAQPSVRGGKEAVTVSDNPSAAKDLQIKQVSKTATIYAENHLAADALGIVQASTEVFVGGEQDGFSFGRDIPISGWIHAKLITTGSDSAFVNYPGATVRTNPGHGAQVVTLYPIGHEVNILEHVTDWYRIALADVDGWIQAEFLSSLQPVTRIENMESVPNEEKPINIAVPEEAEFVIDSAIQIPKDSVLYVDESSQSTSVGRLISGLQIGTPKDDKQMVEVPTAVKTYGWIHSSLVTQDGNSGTVKSNRVRVRYDPDTSKDNIIRIFDAGEKVTLIERVDDWYKIDLGAQRGWISLQP